MTGARILVVASREDLAMLSEVERVVAHSVVADSLGAPSNLQRSN